MEQQLAERIVVSNDILHGKPRIRGTRIAVVQVLDLLAAGKTAEEIVSEDYFPDLTYADIQACIAYASAVIRNDELFIVE